MWQTTLLVVSSFLANPGGALSAATPSETSTPPAAIQLSQEFERWLEEVRPLMTGSERALFATLRHDYQRRAFIEDFWRVRDPFPETGRNEMRERYEERIAYARANYRTLEDDRAGILAVHGPPGREVEVRCTTTRVPAIIWAYSRSEQVDFGFVVIFSRDRGGTAPAKIWHPGRAGLDNLARASRACVNGILLEDLVNQIRSPASDYPAKLSRVLLKPRPRSLEWVAAFSAASTDLAADAPTLNAELSTQYLGRHQSRTVAQSVVSIPMEEASIGEYAGHRSYDFLLLGEILHEGELFESFRYKFGYPADSRHTSLPLPFQRLLRPGEFQMVLKIEDLNGGRFARIETELSVPALDATVEIETGPDSETTQLFEEATAALVLGDTSVRLIPPSSDLQTGLVRFDTLTTGEIDGLSFLLDGKHILTKKRPPFNVELDLGEFPRTRSLRVEARNEAGRLVATDELQLNAGGQRFGVRLIEPRQGIEYQDSLLARVETKVPDGATLERVELYLNEDHAATLYQEPFVQPLALAEAGALGYVRAVAFLADGNSTEHMVFINAPDHLEEVEIQFVELFASVTDRTGRPIAELDKERFRVSEDGVEQLITRFERVEDLPIHVGVLIDNSASMANALEGTRKAALRFLEQTIQSRDRAAIITFNRFPELRVKLTNELARLGGGLAGLTAEGQTALYDSLMFGLYYFSGVSGQRAILLLSDGRDEVSRFSFEETLEYARRAGVTVFAVGLEIPEGTARRRLAEIARETGGESYFLNDIDKLTEVYDAIERELRSQYFLAYQSTNTSKDNRFRVLEVKVESPGARVKTMSGYYP